MTVFYTRMGNRRDLGVAQWGTEVLTVSVQHLQIDTNLGYFVEVLAERKDITLRESKLKSGATGMQRQFTMSVVH